MNKQLLLQHILVTLEEVHQGALNAAKRAYETATDSENEAENKYDTMGLEASYLAYGQSQRVLECENDVEQFKRLQQSNMQFSNNSPIAIGALILLEDDHSLQKNIFFSPVAGGLKVMFGHQEITLLTPSSPLGKALSGQHSGDEIEILIASEKKYYEIINVQ
ncbi:GreA/GreB family elongation factor [sulfur-oxidizing endosymbiont of Gigantopelta aegis]|uniref:GreA/GreB family elongation factor n=1 Tax=sulfur-oxidizing endosymbiont of Gigantopelta aegis TaxID=2794934 RepID=UPI0018DB056A|nr:GreA/GreB family elongation factor [sulfur-oxidizing endosymbiont of Gigantopelta aegis]